MSRGMMILAAGSAARMGKAKMLLPFSTSTILGHIIQEAQSIHTDCLCVVTGFYHNDILNCYPDHSFDIIYNEDWKEGMASSIRKGLSFLLTKQPKLSSVLLLVGDQPYLNEKVLNEMYALYCNHQKGIIASQYGSIMGTPVLFDKKYFSQLLELKGDTGAKSILQQNEADCGFINFPLGAIDIDTPEDYENLCLQNGKKHA